MPRSSLDLERQKRNPAKCFVNSAPVVNRSCLKCVRTYFGEHGAVREQDEPG